MVSKITKETAYGIQSFLLDYEEDRNKLPISAAPGSKAFCCETGTSYILNNEKKWVEFSSNNSGGSSSEVYDLWEGGEY